MQEVKRFLKLAISMVVWTGDRVAELLQRLVGRPRANRGIVFYYHAVPDSFRDRFVRELDAIERRATVVSLDKLLAAQTRDYVALTFDDAYASVLQNAIPELCRRGMPCTVFVPSGYLGKRPDWIGNPDHPLMSERVMTADELKSLRGDGISFGSHGVLHERMAGLTPESMDREYRDSKAALESELGCSIRWFSCPYGDYDATSLARARAAGYDSVFTSSPGLAPTAPENAWVVGRVAAELDDSKCEFLLKLSGAYRWLHALHRLKTKSDPAGAIQ